MTAATQDWALQAQDLSYAYPGTAPVFQHVSLGVRKREIVCLLGGSGCGKSSLLRVLAGLQPPSTGAIQFLDVPMREPDPRSALVFQQASLLPWLNVTGNAGFGLDFKHQPQLTREAHQARVAQAIDAVGLPPYGSMSHRRAKASTMVCRVGKPRWWQPGQLSWKQNSSL